MISFDLGSKTDKRANPVIVLQGNGFHVFETRNEASIFLFNKIDREALDNAMRNPTTNCLVRYQFEADRIEFDTNSLALA
jgi:hypothetical protein